MKREDKFGYGFLLVGIAMPYFIEHFFGEVAGVIAATICGIAGISFIAAGHIHERRVRWNPVGYGALMILVIAITSSWMLGHPDMRAVIAGSSSAELDRVDSAVLFNVDMFNSGPPSITQDWKLEAILKNGEKVWGERIINAVIATDGGRTFFPPDFLDNMTATKPIITGARIRGVLGFRFEGIPRERVDDLDTKLVLSFRDVKNRPFKTEYKFPALTRSTFDVKSAPIGTPN
jgi:hypothetical protein